MTGAWSIGGTAACTTDTGGLCVVTRPSVPSGTKTVTFTVTGVTHATLTYNAASNHDADGDSNGTSIVVRRR